MRDAAGRTGPPWASRADGPICQNLAHMGTTPMQHDIVRASSAVRFVLRHRRPPAVVLPGLFD